MLGYACGSRAYGARCENTITVHRELIQNIVVEGIRNDLRRPGLAKAIEREVERRTKGAMQDRRRLTWTPARTATLERQIANLTDAIASGALRNRLPWRRASAPRNLSCCA